MNPDFQADVISQISKFQQFPDGALRIEGVEKYGQPLTQVGGTPNSRFFTASGANNFFDYQFTLQDNSQDMDTGAYVLTGAPFGCSHMPVLVNPYGSDDPQVNSTCFWPIQMGHPAARLLADQMARVWDFLSSPPIVATRATQAAYDDLENIWDSSPSQG